jgi:hypothetical protein
MTLSSEEKKALEKELKNIRLLYIGGAIFSGLVSFILALLIQQIRETILPFVQIEFFTGIWFWSLVIVSFCVCFISWISIFGLITRARKVRKRLSEVERL